MSAADATAESAAASPTQGDLVTLTATVANAGPDATSPVVAVRAPGTTLVGSHGGAVEGVLGSLIGIGPLAPGASDTVVFSFEIQSDALDPLTFELWAAGLGLDTNPGDGMATVPFPFDPANLEEVAANAPARAIAEGARTRITVLGRFDRGPVRDLTTVADIDVSDPQLVSVDDQGVVTTLPGSSGGEVMLDVQFEGSSDTLEFSIAPPSSTLLIECDEVRLPVGQSTSCQAAAGGSSVGPVPAADATWSCPGSVAQCSTGTLGSGRVECIAAGTASVVASSASGTASLPFHCIAGVPAFYHTDPLRIYLEAGQSDGIDVVAIRGDSSVFRVDSQDILLDTGDATVVVADFASQVPLLSGIAAGGTRVIATGAGDTTLSGSDELAILLSTDVTVDPLGPPPSEVIESAPFEIIVPENGSQSLELFASVEGRSFSLFPSWQSADDTIALVIQSAWRDRVVTAVEGVGAGTTTLTGIAFDPVAADSVSFVVPVTVRDDLVSLTLEPEGGGGLLRLTPNTEQRVVASASYADGTVVDVTRDVALASSNPNVAAVSGLPRFHFAGDPRAGAVIGRNPGTAMLSANYAGEAATLVASVTGAPLTAVFVSGDSAVKRGTRGRTFYVGQYADGTFANLDGVARCFVVPLSSPTALGCGNGRRDRGALYGFAPGTVDVFVQLGGMSSRSPVAVHDMPLVSLSVSGPPSLVVGDRIVPSVFATFSDGVGTAFQDFGGEVLFQSSNPGVLRVGNAPGQRGLVEAVAAGSALVFVEWTDDVGVPHTGAWNVEVTAPP